MKRYMRSYLILTVLISLSCGGQPGGSREGADPARFVNPFVGTKNMGHTYPGATAPFGMVQLSPETAFEPMFSADGSYNRETYRYCSGYQYEDSTVYGFSHTHFSGTGHSDLGDFLVMPQSGSLDLEPESFRSGFSHDDEIAEPGYYRVLLEDFGILAELTATERVGIHRYTFPGGGDQRLVLDLAHNIYHHENKNVWTFVRVEDDTLVTGFRQTKGWARTRVVYFAMSLSRPFVRYGHRKYDEIIYNGFYRRFEETEDFPEMAGREIRAWFEFDPAGGERIEVRFALSPVSTAGALKNLAAEASGKSFDAVRRETRKKWNAGLSKISVETMTPGEKVTFYTALYHTMLGPVLYEDVDGSYMGLDRNVHTSDGFTNYTIFSLWDTFRALHPLFSLIHAERTDDLVRSMMAHYEQSVHGMLPVWSHYANENWCMIGYHSVSAIADALVKGATDADPSELLAACVSTSTVPYFDALDIYMELGYVPEDMSSNSVSKTLEFAYDDWCVAQIAGIAGNEEIYDEYMRRSEGYALLFDESTGFMRPRLLDGTWKLTFDPLDTHGQGFIEGNAWTYSLFVPHDVEGMIELMGGEERFVERLDSLFTMELPDRYIERTEDITRDGIIGNYVHGNEPGHHIPYLYNWTSQPWKTQERVRMILDTMYGPGEDGLCGNDDAGQMSAWYVLSALGFYPVCPGSDLYEIGSPSVVSADVRLGGGKVLRIRTTGQAAESVYVRKVELNGRELGGTHLHHRELAAGGELRYYLDSGRGPGR